jgi:hypothetical protein
VKNDWQVKHIPYQKKHKKLPDVLTHQEISDFLSIIENPKYLAIAAAFYGSYVKTSMS